MDCPSRQAVSQNHFAGDKKVPMRSPLAAAEPDGSQGKQNARAVMDRRGREHDSCV